MKNCSLFNGDTIDVMKTIPDKSVDMILCDLPYGTTACSWDVIIPFDQLWEQYKRIIKKNGAIVLFGSEPFASNLRMSNSQWFKYDLIWEKSRGSNFVHANYQPLKVHENIMIFSSGGSAQGSSSPMTYNKIMTPGKPYHKGVGHQAPKHTGGGHTAAASRSLQNITGDRYPRSVLYFASEATVSGLHPTQKPEALCEYLIKTYSNEGETVLDNTMGSGTTGVACINTNRKFIGIERDVGYFEIAQKRISETTLSISSHITVDTLSEFYK